MGPESHVDASSQVRQGVGEPQEYTIVPAHGNMVHVTRIQG